MRKYDAETFRPSTLSARSSPVRTGNHAPFAAIDSKSGARMATSAIVDHRLWADRLDSTPDLWGQTIPLGGTAVPVVGVMPDGFTDPVDPDVRNWTPLRYDASLDYTFRTCRHLRAVAIQGVDLLVKLAPSGVPFAVALAACWVPALRAARIDPVLALRSDG